MDCSKTEDFLVPTSKIKVKDGLPRLRQDLTEIDKLVASFARYGQLQPILINREFELIDGGRRLAACILSGRDVLVCYNDAVDVVLMREMELEANLQREDLTPAEEAAAVKEIHELKQKIHGKSESGKEGGWTLEHTAELLGVSKGSVILDLQLATAVENYQELKGCKTKSEIKSAVKALDKLAARIASVSSYEEILAANTETCRIIQAGADRYMSELNTGSINILLTDPPFGIDYDETGSSVGGRTGTDFTTSGFKFNDNRDDALYLYKRLAWESVRFCTFNAHGFIFVGPEHFQTVRQMFIETGWQAYIKPMLWIKRETGQCNAPHAWPSSCYEMILYVRKADSRLVKEGQPDWIQCDPVLPSERVHPAEKPVELLMNLLSRVSLPGQTMCDPFFGSGASIEAGLRSQLICCGCDNAVESYAAASGRVARLLNK